MVLTEEQIKLITKLKFKSYRYFKEIELKDYGKFSAFQFILEDGTEFIVREEDLNDKWTEYCNKNSYRYISKEDRYKILTRQRWNCNICSCKLKYSSDSLWIGKIAHIDHIHPFSKRESYPRGIEFINEMSNLQGLCPQCNLNKASKEIN